MKVLYLDESGEHNPAVCEPRYPIFVLGGVVVDKDYADNGASGLARVRIPFWSKS